MTIKVVCSCGSKFAAREELAGKSVECAACGGTVDVPRPVVSAGMSGGARAALGGGMTILTVAVAACGYMIYGMQGQVSGLEEELAAEQARVSGLQTELAANSVADAEAAMKLAANSVADAEAATMSEAEKARLVGVEEDLAAETERQNTLLESLDKLSGESIQVKNQILEVERRRDELIALEQAKRALLARQMTALQTQLKGKTSAAETARIRAKITKVEAARAQLAQEAVANRTTIAAYATQVSGLRTDLRTKSAAQTKLLADLAKAERRLGTLENTPKPVNYKKDIADLQRKVAINKSPTYQTVSHQEFTRGRPVWFRLDTRTGNVRFRSGGIAGVITGGPGGGVRAAKAAGQNPTPGKFQLALTMDVHGDVDDLVLVDTATGDAWICDAYNARNGSRWQPMVVWRVNRQGRPPSKGTWTVNGTRIGPGALATEALVLTDPDGTVYDNSATGFFQNWFIPVY